MNTFITIMQKREVGLEVETITRVPVVSYSELETDTKGTAAAYMSDAWTYDNIEIAFETPGHAIAALSAALRALIKLYPEDGREVAFGPQKAAAPDLLRTWPNVDPRAYPRDPIRQPIEDGERAEEGV